MNKVSLIILLLIAGTGFGNAQITGSVGTYTPNIRSVQNELTVGVISQLGRDFKMIDSNLTLNFGLGFRYYNIAFIADYVEFFGGNSCPRCYFHHVTLSEIILPVAVTKYFNLKRHKRGDFRTYGIRLGLIPIWLMRENQTKVTRVDNSSIAWKGSSKMVGSIDYLPSFFTDLSFAFVKSLNINESVIDVSATYYIGLIGYNYYGNSKVIGAWVTNDIKLRKDGVGFTLTYHL